MAPPHNTMSSFKHNPYQQFSSQPSPSAVERRAALQQQQQQQQQQEVPQRPLASPIVCPAPYSPLSSGTVPTSPPSFSSGNRVLVSRDVSSGGNADGLPHASPLSSTTTATTLRSPVLSSNVSSPHLHFDAQRESLSLPGAMPHSAPTSSNRRSPLTPASRPPWQPGDTAGSFNPCGGSSGLAASYSDPISALGHPYNFYAGDRTEVVAGSPSSNMTPLSAVAAADKPATTLFIDGLPSSIENQYQLCPYVPPQGRVKVRVKRSNGRDVGFAEYDGVDSASAALEWFRGIRTMKETVQTSGCAAMLGAVGSHGGTCCSCGRAYAAPSQSQPQPHTAESTYPRSYTQWVPVAYNDYLALRDDPVQFAQLLRQCVSLRVEWARTREAQHTPAQQMAGQPAQVVEGAAQLHTLSSPLQSIAAMLTSMHAPSLPATARPGDHTPATMQTNTRCYEQPPPPPPLPQQQRPPQRLYSEEVASPFHPPSVTSTPSCSTGRAVPTFTVARATGRSRWAGAAQFAERRVGDAERGGPPPRYTAAMSRPSVSPTQPSSTTTTTHSSTQSPGLPFLPVQPPPPPPPPQPPPLPPPRGISAPADALFAASLQDAAAASSPPPPRSSQQIIPQARQRRPRVICIRL
ncbi:hypothetical protein ABB37_07404 [Leptomonas pyrrhocoris]|uniref:RRM domain-containing protein n=1 Tax=Leptomonas pyrrhocoris TaxID=157538 RepID=A0A0N0VE15_LEPPY|nr:hypothetical protein ABB37_07404 [Leptomonas pyrrhocoris]KPA77071.1 hypothetical protein ABB37_07404 [Leptomonas pyrrhocoris]|eukprot:XP_015655510.1 hypothetical protein ABB37_07404 [Leptomonas pyrrhocoris]